MCDLFAGASTRAQSTRTRAFYPSVSVCPPPWLRPESAPESERSAGPRHRASGITSTQANEEAHVASRSIISPASCPTDTSRLAFGNTPTKSQTPKHWSTTPLVHAFLHHLSLDPTISILDQRHRKKVDTSRNLKTDLETASRPRLERAVQNISQICA